MTGETIGEIAETIIGIAAMTETTAGTIAVIAASGTGLPRWG